MITVLLLLLPLAALAGGKDSRSPLDLLIEQSAAGGGGAGQSAGSLYTAYGRYGDLARDLRAASVNDLVTIVVADRASAAARGSTNSNRKSSASSSIASLGGVTRAAGPLANLASFGGESKLDGQSQTSRETNLNTTLTARVAHVLPNGNLVLEGTKEVTVNSERQLVTVRGVVRWNDLSAGNLVRSDRLGHLEVRVNGKGVVGDAIRRPNFLYRLLLGALPF
jgi:flagellar L-ring protein precursor FlgH